MWKLLLLLLLLLVLAAATAEQRRPARPRAEAALKLGSIVTAGIFLSEESKKRIIIFSYLLAKDEDFSVGKRRIENELLLWSNLNN